MTPVSARNSPGPDWIPFGWTRRSSRRQSARISKNGRAWRRPRESRRNEQDLLAQLVAHAVGAVETGSRRGDLGGEGLDRKSTRLNSSHANISYAVFCLKKKKKKQITNNEFKNKEK